MVEDVDASEGVRELINPGIMSSNPTDMILRAPYQTPGKRVAARLDGRSPGTCHEGGSSFGRNSLRTRYCVLCGTLYHTYDCGNRLAAVGIDIDPEECPKVRSF